MNRSEAELIYELSGHLEPLLIADVPPHSLHSFFPVANFRKVHMAARIHALPAA